jgi:Creatinine amidohydrolase
MHIEDMNWMQVEAYLERDDRCVLPIGSTEQHGYLSLGVDLILAERVSIEAAEPLGVPVFPVIVRKVLGDGVYGGAYEKPDDLMLGLWRVGVEETRDILEGPWPSRS